MSTRAKEKKVKVVLLSQVNFDAFIKKITWITNCKAFLCHL